MTNVATPAFEIFMSYSRKDNVPVRQGEPGWVTALREEILIDHRRFLTEPLRIFFDTADIRGMDDWRHRILEGLRHSKILLVCLSPNYFKSDYCWWEWQEYHLRQMQSLAGQDTVTPVYFVEVPGSDEYQNAAQVEQWLSEIKRAEYAADLRPWFPQGAAAMRDDAVRKHIEALGNSLWERIERARRAAGVPGNLRRLNPHFVGRKQELRELHERLATGTIGVVTAVHGLGGQGKTELATAYAHLWAYCYPGGLWVLAAEQWAELLPLLGQLAGELDLPLSAGPEETAADRGRRVLRELKRRALAVRDQDPDGGAARLVLLDNVTEPALLSEPELATLPREDWLRVVATTRLGQDVLTASPRQSLAFVPVDKLLADDALELLRDHQPVRDAAGQPVLSPTPPQLSQPRRFASPAEEVAAREIVRELDGFALAMEAVALYLGLHPEVAPSAYLSRLRREGLVGADALGAEPEVAAQLQHREKQLALVLNATLNGLDGPALAALEYAALLPPDSIVWPWLRALVQDEHPAALAHQDGYPDPWSGVRRRLAGLRLITPGDHLQIGRLHRLVAAHLVQRLSVQRRDELTARLDRLLEQEAGVFEQTWIHDPSVLWLLRPLQETVWHLSRETTTNLNISKLAGVVGTVEQQIGRLDASLKFFELSHRIAQAAHEADTASEDAVRTLSVSLNDLGDFYLGRGQSGDAERALAQFEESLRMAQQLYEANPNSAQAARDVSVSRNKLGDFYLGRGQSGDAERALAQFEESHRILQQLYEANPNSAQAARDVSVSSDRLGDFYLGRGQSGDAERALAQFEESLRIRQQLYEANPNSAQAARDVSVSRNKLGDFYLGRGQSGDAERALAQFEESHRILQQLYEANPNSAQAARDVSVSRNKLGDFYLGRGQSGDAERALAQFEESLRIRQQLYEANPNSAQAARDVSVSRNKLGDFYLGRGQSGDAERALAQFEESLRMDQQLYEANPNSAQAARDVSVSRNKLGDFYLGRGQSGDAERALAQFEESHRILQQLYEANPNSAQAARDVSVSSDRLGDFYLGRGQSGDAERALAQFEESHRILQQLYEANPNSAQAARDVSVSHERLGDFYLGRGQSGDAERALAQFEESLRMAQQLYEANPNSAQAARDVSVSRNKLGAFYLGRGQSGDAERALAQFEESHRILQQLYEANPNSAQAARDVLVSLERMGDVTAAQPDPQSQEQALSWQLQALELAVKLREQNPASVFFGRTAAVSFFKTSQRANAGGQQELASQCLAGCHAVLHELLGAGCELDAAMVGLYQQLHPLFEGE